MWRHRVPVLLVILAASPARATVLTMADDGTIQISPPPRAARRAPPPLPQALSEPPIRAADAARLADDLIASIAWVESHYRLSARSPAGAIGLMQLLPGTARDLRVDPHDPAANLAGGAAYLRALLDRFDGDLVKALAAYNAGPAAVERHQGVPPYPETRRYVAAVLARLATHLP